MNDIDMIEYMESFYADRMMALVSADLFEDAHAVYSEFVIDHQEPEGYIYLKKL